MMSLNYLRHSFAHGQYSRVFNLTQQKASKRTSSLTHNTHKSQLSIPLLLRGSFNPASGLDRFLFGRSDCFSESRLLCDLVLGNA